MAKRSAGLQFKTALELESPLQIVGTINAYAALMAERVGYRVIYLSGAGVANASFGLPDLALTSLDNVLEEVRRITSATELPLLVDADTGWGSALNVARSIKQLEKAGAAGIHLEDQIFAKRCGHLGGKVLVTTALMRDYIKAAVDAREDADFVLMARTDAVAVEGFNAAIERANHYIEAGADMIFAEALTDLEQYAHFVNAVPVPVLANITEFGKTPLFSREQLASVGIQMILYPLSVFRAMNAAALQVLQTIRTDGTQQNVTHFMQTREDLYDYLRYTDYERQ